MSSKTYFDTVADQWDEMRQSFFPDSIRDLALDRVNVQAGELALDVGAGTGFLTEALLHRGLRVIAVDQSLEMLTVLEERLDAGDSIITRQGESEALPLTDGEVSYTFANMYLHHVEHPAVAIKEMARVLKPGGKLVITDLDAHDYDFLVEEQHDRWKGFDRADIEGWFADAGLTEITVKSAESDCCADSSCGTERAEVSIFIALGTKQ